MNFMVCFMHWGWVHEYWQRLGTGELYGLPHVQGMGAGEQVVHMATLTITHYMAH